MGTSLKYILVTVGVGVNPPKKYWWRGVTPETIWMNLLNYFDDWGKGRTPIKYFDDCRCGVNPQNYLDPPVSERILYTTISEKCLRVRPTPAVIKIFMSFCQRPPQIILRVHPPHLQSSKYFRGYAPLVIKIILRVRPHSLVINLRGAIRGYVGCLK